MNKCKTPGCETKVGVSRYCHYHLMGKMVCTKDGCGLARLNGGGRCGQHSNPDMICERCHMSVVDPTVPMCDICAGKHEKLVEAVPFTLGGWKKYLNL